MKEFLGRLLGGRLLVVLIVCFSLFAALTVGVFALATSRVISNYLVVAEDERVARDMDLADAFYQGKLDEVAAITYRLSLDHWVNYHLPGAIQDRADAITGIDQQITNKITVLALGGTHFIAVVDNHGEILVGRVLSADGELSPIIKGGNWGELPIIAEVLFSGEGKSATEVIPVGFLEQVGLEDQAHVTILETLKAQDELYDSREGTAGLTLTGVSPLKNQEGNIVGAVVAAYLFNNDFTLVDRIKEVAGVDTVTIFFGDLRVSTNVMTENRERAVGTRVSEDVYKVVLEQGKSYVGNAFVVNQMYISQYEPLRDHAGDVVGILYVGALQSTFQALVDTFQYQVILIALVCIVLAGVIAVPISRLITLPVLTLVEANRQLAQGNMAVQVQATGEGELAILGRSFNKMVNTLRQTQQELLQKEKLASMGQLAAGIAHEINNPLGTILLFSDVMYKEASKDDPRRDDLNMIISETKRCQLIVANLLNFARQQDVLAQQTDIHLLMDLMIKGFEQQPTFKDIEVIREYSLDLPLIQADPGQLQQVFINLITNAAEAMEDGGTLTISTRTIDDRSVEIKFTDTGCGIPEEDLNKIFTPFFTTKVLGKGTGLGLSIIYGIIKMHRGQIAVQSKIWEGTTFTITLPVRLPVDVTDSPRKSAI
ncbi:MAG: cache domain-containing protein [Anaerolineales bacterium]